MVVAKVLPARAAARVAARGSSAFSRNAASSAAGLARSKKADAGCPRPRIHPHVKRPFIFDRKTAARIIQLHGGDAQVREDDVRPVQSRLHQRPRQAGEIQAARREHIFPKPQRAQPRQGFGKLHRIGVQSQEPPAGLEARQQFQRVSAVAQRAVHRHLPRLRLQRRENLRHHDRTMRPRRCFARSQDFGDRFRVARGMEFLVFLLEPARVFPGIPRSPFMRCRQRR